MQSTVGVAARTSIASARVSGPPEVPGLQPSEVSRQAESTVVSGATGTTR